jgi:toxin ParE1/3/4
MAHRIVWSRTSQRDLRSLVKYISKDSPSRAEQFGYRIISKVELLKEHPHLGRVVPEFNQAHLRETVVGPYRVIYRCNQLTELIEIVRVWHAARDTPEI